VSYPIVIPDNNVSQGSAKLCHSGFGVPDMESLMTRFPESRRKACGLLVLNLLLLDQTLFPLLSSRSREFVLRVRLPLPPLIGVSRFATQTTVRVFMLLYHIPRYVLSPFEKKPSTKIPCAETSVCPTSKDWPVVSESSGTRYLNMILLDIVKKTGTRYG
jgi:hypothetical protein